jgi:hypothetical protein
MTHRILTLLSSAAVASMLAGAALADDQASTPPAPAAAPAPPPPVTVQSWLSATKFSGDIEAGATFNTDSPANGVNFGHLFTDRSNELVLNQFVLTAERDPDTTLKTVDFGFKFQGLYGSDARFTKFLGELDGQRDFNSFDLVEANLLMHLPFLTPGGTDVKVGQFSTPLGNEVIDATGNFFYSKSYIFNFGIPLKHTGILITTHVNPVLDLYYGYTTGVNTAVGSGGGYNDGQFHFLGGFGLNTKYVTVLALTHIGPEDIGPIEGINVHDYYRYLNDIVITWKVNSKLTSVTELNYIKDDLYDAKGGGVAEYLTYPLSSIITAGLRVEVWRDDQGFYVGGFPRTLDYIRAEEGEWNHSYFPGPMTYGAITVGLNIKPAKLPKRIDGLTIRPEVRYDTDLSTGETFDATHCNVPTKKDQVTIGLDVVVPFTF